MKLKMYWTYLKYVMNHKYNVAIECFKMGLYLHAITHDLSKFLPCEFKPYAKHFYGYIYGNPSKDLMEHRRENFDNAWLLHQNRNKHHWQYWINSSGKVFPMPEKNVKQMVADWRGMARKFGDTAEEYYIKRKHEIVLHHVTEQRLLKYLKV